MYLQGPSNTCMHSGKRKSLKNMSFPQSTWWVHTGTVHLYSPCLCASNKQNVKRAGRVSHIQVGYNNNDSEINPASLADPSKSNRSMAMVFPKAFVR